MNLSTIVKAGAAGMCLLALADMPWAFYQALRFAVVAACVFSVIDLRSTALEEKWKTVGYLIFGMLAIVFNPIFPLEMERESWAWWNLGATGALAISVFDRYRKEVAIVSASMLALFAIVQISEAINEEHQIQQRKLVEIEYRKNQERERESERERKEALKRLPEAERKRKIASLKFWIETFSQIQNERMTNIFEMESKKRELEELQAIP